MSAASDLQIAVEGICREINQNARSRAMRGTNYLRNAALVVLGQNGSGRVYRNGHVASSPGQPPAPDTGNLRRNWRQLPVAVTPNGMGKHGIRIKLAIRSDVFYQQFLEKGTRKMAARPHMKRIKEKARPQIAALFASI